MRNRGLSTILKILLVGIFVSQPVRGAEVNFQINQKQIEIEGLEEEYHFVVVNDVHIIHPDDTTLKEKQEDIQLRYNTLFVDQNGLHSEDLWENVIEEVNSMEKDAVLFNGDLIDFYSDANFQILKQGIEQLNAPFIYLRADHDEGLWNTDQITKEERNDIERTLDGNPRVAYLEYDKFMIVGINNSTSNISENMLIKLKKLWEKNKPIILIQHVPLDSRISDGLREASKEHRENRALLWGKNCCYEPNEYTEEFHNMVLSEDSPVVAVIGAHLHFSYEEELIKDLPEYVFDATYKDNIGYITVKGSAN